MLEIRNATIAPILYLSKSIEQFGSEFKRINNLCNNVGIKYSCENREKGFKFVIYGPEFQSDIQIVILDVTLNGDVGSYYFEAETRFIKGRNCR